MNRRRAIEQSRNRADRAHAARWLARERVREEKKAKRRALAEALTLAKEEEEEEEEEDGKAQDTA